MTNPQVIDVTHPQVIDMSHHTVIDAQLSTINLKLTPQHQAHIAARGIYQPWAVSNCITCEISEASLMLEYKAKSAGIMLVSDEYGQWQFKPDEPWSSKEGKAPKYRTGKGEYDAFLAKHPTINGYWRDLDALKARCFTIDGKPYLLITEGGFKAIMGCQHGIPTVALVGVTMGLTPKAKGEPDLIPALKKLAEAGFGFIIAFDADVATNKNVRIAEAKLSKVLAAYGCSVKSVTGLWEPGINGETKGMDDFINVNGIEAFRQTLIKARDFSNEARDTRDNKADKPPTPRQTANKIAEEYDSRWQYDNEQKTWRVWTGREWEKTEIGTFTSLLKTTLDARNVNYKGIEYINNVLKLLECDLRQNHWQTWDRTQFINFSNCVLDGKKGETLEHSPGMGFTSHLPYEYKPLAGDTSDPLTALATNCPNISKFMRTAMKGDDKKVFKLLAIVNGVLKFRFHDLQQFVHLVGKPGSGKGTFARLLEKLVGRENFKGCSLERLKDGSTMASIVDKQLVVFADERKPVGIESILSLTGGDAVSYRELHTPAADAFFYGLLLICSNKPIFIGDTTGLERRLCLVHFDNAIPVEARDYSMESGFESEIPALIAIALSMPDSVVSQAIQGVGASRIAEYKAKEWEMKCEVNSVAAFFDVNLVLDSAASSSTSKLYDLYKVWCEESGLKALSVVKFPRYLAELISDEDLPAKWVKARTSNFEGLRWRLGTDEHPTYSQVLDGSAPVELRFCTSSAPVDAPVKPLPSNTLHQLHQLKAKSREENSINENFLPDTDASDYEFSGEIENTGLTGATGATPLPVVSSTGASTGEQLVQNTPPTGATKRHHKEFQIGDRVRILDNGLHHGKDGEVVAASYGSVENDYRIALDKESHLSREVVVTVPHSQKFPILMNMNLS